ncbi:hypothetical protein BDV34DRAFT_102970 [Aspergillus parasiticus]|uniref:Uncharacterized protein n=1 Tax=Aspergillus parasiticus TaxID=5067 RepID=A0A5N6DJG6_ASPPA|nr:hypothetical protein BDV34DRAFT_102970 [Aspergillus parasiticus]
MHSTRCTRHIFCPPTSPKNEDAVWLPSFELGPMQSTKTNQQLEMALSSPQGYGCVQIPTQTTHLFGRPQLLSLLDPSRCSSRILSDDAALSRRKFLADSVEKNNNQGSVEGNFARPRCEVPAQRKQIGSFPRNTSLAIYLYSLPILIHFSRGNS